MWSPSLFFSPYLTHSPGTIQYSSVVQHIAVTLSANKTKQWERKGGREKRSHKRNKKQLKTTTTAQLQTQWSTMNSSWRWATKVEAGLASNFRDSHLSVAPVCFSSKERNNQLVPLYYSVKYEASRQKRQAYSWVETKVRGGKHLFNVSSAS